VAKVKFREKSYISLFSNPTKQMAPWESTAEEVLFDHTHFTGFYSQAQKLEPP